MDEKTVQLVLMEHQFGRLPGNAVWSCMQLPAGSVADIWRLMGHRVIEMPKEDARKILSQMEAATQLQVTLREYYKKAEGQ
jgi:hypothetical protein